MLSDTPAAYQIERQGDRVVLRCYQPLRLQWGHAYIPAIEQLQTLSFTVLQVDCSTVSDYDTFFLAFLQRLRAVAQRKQADFEVVGLTESVERFRKFFIQPDRPTEEEVTVPSWQQFFERVGKSMLRKRDALYDFFAFLGTVLIDFALHPTRVRWRDFPTLFFAAGVSAVPLVVLIATLIGVILGYQGAVQLRQFGADVYLADLIAISITRELGPLMTAIIVAGRTGAAFAAEIGTMKVNEELDALKVMGVEMSHFLFLPRIFAVLLATPILSLMADAAGIVGGMIMALLHLDFTLSGYLVQTQQALSYTHVFSGIFKSVFFGFVVGIIGCFQGTQVRAGSADVGKAATVAVVTSILLIICLDALFAVLFQVLGI